MSFYARIIEWITPMAAKLAEKYLPVLIQDLYGALKLAIKYFFEKRKKDVKMAKILFTVSVGSTAIEGATIKVMGIGSQTTDANGQTTFEGLTVNTAYSYMASKIGYADVSGTATPIDDSTTLDVSVPMTVVTASTPATTKATAATTTSSISSDKTLFKELDAAVKAAIAAVKAALKSQVVADIQIEGATLISKAKTDLANGATYYKGKISSASGISKLEYISMYAGILILQLEVNEIITPVLEYLESEVEKI